ncbi:Lysine-specific demethylase, partial [Actinidia chinensis var. chinensis]
MRDVEIPNWLKGLPLAPEFRPTDTEFADPISYISKIEKEASIFGICKVIPPLPKPSKKFVVSNLNKSLLKNPELGRDLNLGGTESGNEANDGEARAVFTTRQQELGQNAKTTKKVAHPQPPPVRKLVWQSGEIYTLEQFESKSKSFAKNQLGSVKDVSPLAIEALFWKAASEKPIHIEYANDVPGSGFGEPEGSFRYFHRRRRRRTFNRNTGGSYNSGKYQVNSMSSNYENKEESAKNSPNSSRETSKVSISLPTISSNQTSQFSRQKSSTAAKEMEGSAGWKLSNCHWNLQVIARSPGSLTRFMPDDIPGVTSPMVYIGMLFSWFAWHVEDHELHSLNFLHTGSPKTWYAVPGDYAFAFEEVIRNQGYGGNIDRLAALTLLGEKTTLLSPEVVVESGIPCCRLIQNPGEFVVTFPRAYHVGFSHGFNCGEAANFGTSKWLNVAKEAAVRRAAMNHLPMLSHQQLLYLLTMSFASRVPRSLLPGARNSRLRDRQKEERELSVKKAFIEDILNENNLLTILLGKNSSYHVVLWDLESLPSPRQDPALCSNVAPVETAPRKDVCYENKNNQDLFSEMSLYMETVNDLYADCDDLSCNFQVDSGALACVACGILGFPFMSVVQPSEKASMDLQDLALSNPMEFHSPAVLDHMVEGFVSDGLKDKIERNDSNALRLPNETSSSAESANSMVLPSEDLSTSHDPSPPPKDLPVSSEAKFEKGWSASRGFLRPRIFCMEHAIQIEEMLHSKGGANVLVICHSDFQKIKAHVATVAEEIDSRFGYNEISLDDASQEDLNLIDLAIDGEEHDECGEDWTSKLSINLRHCVKVRKNSASKQVQHALALGGLFSDSTPGSNTSNLKWPSRKSRSKRNINHSLHIKPSESIGLDNPVQEKPSESIQIEKVEVMGAKLDDTVVRKEGKLIQYSRKNFKSKPSDSAAPVVHMQEVVSIADCGGPDEHGKNISRNNLCNIEDTGKKPSGLSVLCSNGESELQHNSGVLVSIGDLSGHSVPSQIADSLIALASEVENSEAQLEENLEEMIVDVKATNDSMMGDGSEIEHETKVDESIQETGRFYAEKSSTSLSTAVERTANSELQHDGGVLVSMGDLS